MLHALKSHYTVTTITITYTYMSIILTLELRNKSVTNTLTNVTVFYENTLTQQFLCVLCKPLWYYWPCFIVAVVNVFILYCIQPTLRATAAKIKTKNKYSWVYKITITSDRIFSIKLHTYLLWKECFVMEGEKEKQFKEFNRTQCMYVYSCLRVNVCTWQNIECLSRRPALLRR